MSFSKLISALLHPIFIPFMVFCIIERSMSKNFFLALHETSFVYLVILFSTLVFPTISVFVAIKKKYITSLEIADHKQRHFILIPSLFFTLSGLILLENFTTNFPIIQNLYLGGVFVIFLSIIISRKWKISLHLLTIGSGVGAFFGIYFLYGELLFWLLVFIFLSGLLGYARLKEKAHTKPQVYIGFLVGCFVEYACVVYF